MQIKNYVIDDKINKGYVYSSVYRNIKQNNAEDPTDSLTSFTTVLKILLHNLFGICIMIVQDSLVDEQNINRIV